MSERLFRQLTAWLQDGPLVLACVLRTEGATPRKAGAMMLLRETESYGSVGGGEAEGRVMAAAQQRLRDRHSRGPILEVDLGGGAGAAGICGGRMQIALRVLASEQDRIWAEQGLALLERGQALRLDSMELGVEGVSAMQVRLAPNPRLLIVGAGHCGLALYDVARLLDFDIWLYDEREGCVQPQALHEAICLSGPVSELRKALHTVRPVFAVLLTRNYQCDVDALRVLAEHPPRWIGMMGSRKRIRQVTEDLQGLILSDQRGAPLRLGDAPLVAPVGLEIGAETPHEIAVSIAAQLLMVRSAVSPSHGGLGT
ncbi:XdhC family protein [Pseudomarimonas arenosa]|uniref:XdhC family protein n=1 Tax=Pseudomarimonas arenosa TaxID=2774145 RepID=A0AAW3ZKN3_9GAMM|nr:XdhC/CoxI family protein [Pseudomarimonas arenosa]MBD8525617.1 XdhC family protein [Pseudomarimonas arenosa]